jgi:hypothetical protein
MSIGDVIKWRVREGMLFPLIPKAAGTSPKRALFLTKEIYAALNEEHEDEGMEDRLGQLQADLELFSDGQMIDPKYLFLLYPARQAVWEIRSVRPMPSIRVLGLFAQKDIFIATNWVMREQLGGWQSREWKQVKRRALACWRHLFHTHRPLGTTNINDLVSGAIDGKYFKGI